VRDISQVNIEECAGSYFNNEYRIAYTSDESGSSTNNRVLVYDLIRDAYSLDTENINCFAEYNAGSDFGTLYSGSSSTDGKVIAHSGNSMPLSKRYESDFTPGTFNDTRVYGTEKEPVIEIAWNCTIATWLTELQAKNASISNISSVKTYLPNSTIARPDDSGDWTSPSYQVNAGNFSKLYWNENLGTAGNVTFQLRANSSSSMAGINWSSEYTNPSGSDISSLSAGAYIQVKANLYTTNTTYSPTLYSSDGYVWKVAYSKVGSPYETSVLSEYKTGWKNFGIPNYKKLIKRVKVFYEGSSGNLTFGFKNEEGTINNNFTIDMAVNPPYDSDTDGFNEYSGSESIKTYTYRPLVNSETSPSPIGQSWKFSVIEDGTNSWKVHKIEFLYDVLPISE
jgi:hypothetical protein